MPETSRRVSTLASGCLLLGVVSCGSDPESACETGYELQSAISMDAWTVASADDDPWPDHRPDSIDCPPENRFSEGSWYEVETGGCNYLTVEQPALRAFEAGTTAQVGLLHFDLTAAEDYVAHVAFAVGEHPLWDREIAVRAGEPAPYEAFDDEVPIDFSTPAGTPVYFHLHNHGYNTWNLFGLDTQVCPDD